MKAFLKRAGHAFVAAVTSPEVVTKEKSVVVLVATRVALSLGASAAFVTLVDKLFS